MILKGYKSEEEPTHDDNSANSPPHPSTAVCAACTGSNSCTETKLSLAFQKRILKRENITFQSTSQHFFFYNNHNAVFNLHLISFKACYFKIASQAYLFHKLGLVK